MLRFYHENRVAEPNPPELLLCWVLHYVGDNLQQCLVCSCDSGTVILQVKWHTAYLTVPSVQVTQTSEFWCLTRSYFAFFCDRLLRNITKTRSKHKLWNEGKCWTSLEYINLNQMNLFGVHRAPYSELSMLLHQLKCLRDNGSKLASAMNHFYLVILLQSSQAISQLFWSYNTFNRFYLLLRSMWEMCFGGLLLTCKSMVEIHLDLCGRYDRNWSPSRIFLWQTKPSPSFCLHRKDMTYWLRHRGVSLENFGERARWDVIAEV